MANSKNHIHLKRITFRNFMSYGNNVNEFTFPDGLNWLSAANGCGKSTLVEALNFAFFGKSYRGGKREELRNTMNTEAVLEVCVEFERIQGETREEYFIRRTVDPKNAMKFSVEKKEGDKWVPQNKRAGFTQKDFEDDVLHFNEVLFKNNIAQNTQESIPFIDMEAADRRKLTDSIIMLDNDRLKKENAKELSTAKTNFEIAENDRTRIDAEITDLEKIIAHMEEEKKNNIAQMESTVNDKKALVVAYTQQSTALFSELQGIQAKLGEMKTVLDTEPGIDQAIAGIANAKVQVGLLQQYNSDLVTAQSELAAAEENYAKLPVNELTGQVSGIESQIVGVNADIAGVEAKIGETNQAIAGCDAKVNNLNRERGNVEVNIRNSEFQVSQLTNQMNDVAEQGKSLKPIEIGIPCPTCGKPTDENDVERSKQQIEAQKAELRNKYKELKGKVNGIQAQIGSMNDQIAGIDAEITATQNTRVELVNQIQGFNTEIQGYRAQIQGFNGQIQELNNQIREYNKVYTDTVVPAKAKVDHLKQNIATSENVIRQTGINVDAFVAEENRLKQEKTRIAGVRNEWQTLYDSYSAKNGEYSNINGSIGQMNQEIARIEAEITRIREATDEDALAMTVKRLADARHDLEDATNRWHEASKVIASCNYITGMLSDAGMKKMVYALYIDHFNEVVRKNLLRANLPFVIEFDDTMNFKFISAPGYAPSYTMLSQGQRRKVGFAIAMAFRDFVSLVGNFSVNFMSLDEVLDISTDNYAMREMLDIVRSMVEDIGCVVVITHRGDAVADKFDHKINVDYDGTYSHMGEVTSI